MADPRDDLLIADLRDLAGWMDVPPAPDLRAAVRARLESPAPTRRAPWLGRRARRWVAAAVAALVALVAVVPPARAAVVDAIGGVLRFAGIEIRDEPARPGGLPTQPSPLPSIRSAALDEARRVARFPVRVPAALGVPDEVTLADPAPDGAPRVVTLVYRGGTVRLDAFDGALEIGFLKTAPDARWVQFDGRPAVWLPGPHPVVYVDRAGVERTEVARLAGPTLIWADAGVSYRLEGVHSVDEAQNVARSMI